MLVALSYIRRDIKHAMGVIKEHQERTGNTLAVKELPGEGLLICADEDASEARIDFVKTMAFLFEKFEPDAWWYGVFEIEISRVLQPLQ